MNHILYNKIKELLESGEEIVVIYNPHHKGCTCELTTSINDEETYNYLLDALESWWYDDLTDNYLIPNDIYGGGEFRFIFKNDIINIEADIHMGNDSYDDHNLFDYFDKEVIELFKISFEGKTIDKEHLLFTFDNDGEKIENLEIIYLGENQDDYEQIDITDQIFKNFELKINKITNSLRYYTKGNVNGFVWVSCNENRISITEDWPFNFELKRED